MENTGQNNPITEAKGKELPAKEPETSGATRRAEAAPPILGFLFILIPLYYFLAWRNLPYPAAGKWGITAIAALSLILIYVFFKARTVRVFELISKSIIVLFIASGAVMAAIVFTRQDQTLLFKWFVILYFSMLPPWLYLQFLSTKGKTLWEEYVLNLFRLHVDHYPYLPEPPRHSIFFDKWRNAYETVRMTIGSGKSIYEKKFEGLFGPVPSGAGVPFAVFQGENLWPVAIATWIISVGWVMVVAPETIFNRSFLPAGFQSSVMPKIPLETFRFAFLGAYFLCSADAGAPLFSKRLENQRFCQFNHADHRCHPFGLGDRLGLE